MTTPRIRRRLLVAGAASAVTLSVAIPAIAGDHGFTADRTRQFSMNVYRQQVDPLGTFGGVTVTGDGFGSAVGAGARPG